MVVSKTTNSSKKSRTPVCLFNVISAGFGKTGLIEPMDVNPRTLLVIALSFASKVCTCTGDADAPPRGLGSSGCINRLCCTELLIVCVSWSDNFSVN